MRLHLSDFELHAGYFYTPKYEVQTSDYYNSCLLDFGVNEGYSNWIFKINKADVFKELGWKEELNLISHRDGNGLFPSFSDKHQVTLFLTIAILLHNEKYEKTMLG